MSTAGPTAPVVVRPNDVRRASQDLRKLVAGLDPDAVVTCEAPEVWAEFDAIERLMASAKILLARRVEDARSWQGQRVRSAVDQLARLAGTSVTAAKALLATSKQVAALPDTAEAMRSGELSSAQAAAVAAAAAIAPDAEARLLATAVAQAPLAQLREECLKARAVDVDAAHARIRRDRYARWTVDAEGAWNLHARGPVEDGARFRTAIEPRIDARFKTSRKVEDREPHDAYAFDALIELAERGTDTKPDTGENEARESDAKPKATPVRYVGLIRVDHEALKRGAVEGDEICEIAGLGPIPVAVARELLGESILKLVITKGVDVANLAHLGRSVTVAQQVALWWQQPCCTEMACTRTCRLENDHRYEWVKTHRTRVDESDPLCDHHHDLETYLGRALVEGTGKRPMVPPDHPRHPKYRAPPGA